MIIIKKTGSVDPAIILEKVGSCHHPREGRILPLSERRLDNAIILEKVGSCHHYGEGWIMQYRMDNRSNGQ